MTSLSPVKTTLCFIALLYMPLYHCSAQTPANGAPHMISGIATTTSGKPFANAVLYLGDIPPFSRPEPDLTADNVKVVTDSNGRFHWNVPDSLYPRYDGESGPQCWALPMDATSWSFSVRTLHDTSEVYDLHDALSQAAATCQAKWSGKGSSTQLLVTVTDPGMAAVILQDPSGKVVANRSIDVWSPNRGWDSSGVVLYHSHTDRNGQLTMRWFPGSRQLRVLVPGFGYGATGLFQVIAGLTSTPNLPPLAPFAHLSGLATASHKPGDIVTVYSSGAVGTWYSRSSEIDAQDAWSVDDVMPGECMVTIGSMSPYDGIDLDVAPGETRAGVILKPNPGNSRGRPYIYNATIVTGTVTDTSGQPIAGATVYTVFYYHDVINAPYKKGVATITDASGKYEADAPHYGGPGIECIRVAAVHDGYGVSERAALALPFEESSPPDVHADIILPPKSTTLTIKVLQDGKPVSGASVSLDPENAPHDRNDKWLDSVVDPVNDTLCGFLNPSAVTDRSGIATFTGVFPGLWDASATFNQPSIFRGNQGFGEHVPGSSAVAKGTIVRSGSNNAFTMQLFSQADDISFRVLRPDLQPFNSGKVAIEGNRTGNTYPELTYLTLDSRGGTDFSISAFGLWRLSSAFKDAPLDTNQLDILEPYYAASALFAVSPSVSEPHAVSMGARLYKSGSLRALLTDGSDKPCLGTATLTSDANTYQLNMAEKADGHGIAEFNDLPSGRYTVRASLANPASEPDLMELPLPSEGSLNKRWEILPTDATITSGAEEVVNLQARPVGYVLGKFPILANYWLLSVPSAPLQVRLCVDPATGEFVAGPFLPGPVVFTVQQCQKVPSSPGAEWPVWRIAASVSQDKVALGNIQRLEPDPARISLWMGDVYAGDQQAAFDEPIFMPDGKTPAWGARMALFVPDQWRPITTKRADPAGFLTDNEDFAPDNEPDIKPTGSPDKPVMIAWLPGSNGAAVVPFVAGQKIHIVLPPAISLRGRITVGGKPADGIDSTFRVLAAYQRRGKLNSWLSIDATAQADGSFELAGLTPGTYIVQASRDNIWDSPAQTIVVGKSSLLDVTLNIPSPGISVNLKVLDKIGQPISGAGICLPKTAGPISDTRWPDNLTTDGAGCLHIEGLDAGAQVIRVLQPQATRGAGSLPVKPLGTITVRVPAYVEGGNALEATVHCPPTTSD